MTTFQRASERPRRTEPPQPSDRVASHLAKISEQRRAQEAAEKKKMVRLLVETLSR